MRILTWNLAHNTPGYKARHDGAWDYLLELEPDLAFVQECKPPAGPDQAILWQAAFKDGWGSAIVARSGSVEPVDLSGYRWLRHFGGWVVVARWTSPGLDVIVASVHASWRPVESDLLSGVDVSAFPFGGAKGVWPAFLIFDDLRRLLTGKTFLIGGDLNSDPVMDDKSGFVGGNREFFEALSRDGFVNLATETLPTHRGYTLDYLFGSADLESMTRSTRIDDVPVERKLSDHAPLIIETMEA